jgi:hypothetical protein
MRERRARGDVEAVDARLLEPTADLDRLGQRVAGLLPGEELVVVLDRADLELQVVVVADLCSIARTISSAKRARFSSEPAYSSSRSLTADDRNCVMR